MSSTAPANLISGPGIMELAGVGTGLSSNPGRELNLIDPSSGTILAQEMVPSTVPGPDGTVTIRFAAPTVRESFSRDFTDVGAVGPMEADGSQHVGFVNLTTGSFTDVTAMNETSGFSGHVPVDNGPIFDPVTGNFWFYRDDGTIYDCPLATLRCVSRGHEDTSVSAFNGIRFTATNGVYQFTAGQEPPLINPTGSATAARGDSYYRYGLFVEPPSVSDPTVGVKTTLSTPSDQCLPQAWVTATELICVATTESFTTDDQQLFLLRGLHPGQTGSLVGQPQLPTTELVVGNVTPSPDGNQIAFTGTSGTSATIYIERLDGKRAQPVQVGTIDAGSQLLAWR